MLVALIPSVAYADAVLPSLVLIWPITIFLLLPIIAVEALYSRNPLEMSLWESFRVIGMANVLSSIAGLPVAGLLAAGLQYGLEFGYFRDLDQLHQSAARSGLDLSRQSLTRHDYSTLVFLGLYPRWILLTSTVAMLIVSFLMSWWIEAKWVQRCVRRSGKNLTVQTLNIWRTVRNANVLSYSFMTLIVLWLFIGLWPNK